jgi:hypothetical protein
MKDTQMHKLVKGYVKKWRGRLGLEGWDIRWQWKNQEEIMEDVGYKAHASSAGCVETREAVLNFNHEHPWHDSPIQFDNIKGQVSVEASVAHEMTHLMLSTLGRYFYAPAITRDIHEFLPESTQRDLVALAREGIEGLCERIVILMADKEKE